MKVLLVGSTGYLGSVLAAKFLASGHEVHASVRNDASFEAIRSIGLTPFKGDLADSETICGKFDSVDAVVVSAIVPFQQEEAYLRPLLDRLRGTGKAFIFTSGTGVLSLPSPNGEWHEENFSEDEAFVPSAALASRVEAENLVRGYAQHGVRAMVVRPPLVWGRGGSKQVPAIFSSVDKTGFACFVGAGLNCYSHVHVDDLAELYDLALARGQAGAVYHAVAGEENFRTLAEAVAKARGCTTKSISADEAIEVWGPRNAPFYFCASSRSRSPRSRRELGWKPTKFDIVGDIAHGSYSQ